MLNSALLKGSVMQIDTVILGDYQTNSYVVRKDSETSDCVIIDTGLESAALIDFLKDNNLKPAALILTHGHADHIAAIPAVKKVYPDMLFHYYFHGSSGEPQFQHLFFPPHKTAQKKC